MKRGKTLTQPAKTHFWSTLDLHYRGLIDAASDARAALSSDWYPTVRGAMEDAYSFTCPHETPRQIQAYAQGLRALRLKKPEAAKTSKV